MPEEQGPYPVMPKAAFLGLLAKTQAKQLEMDASRSAIGGLISDASEKHNYHPGAGAIMRKLYRLKPAPREELLYHLRHYFGYAGWDKPTDLFRGERETKPPRSRKRPQLVAGTEAEEQQSA